MEDNFMSYGARQGCCSLKEGEFTEDRMNTSDHGPLLEFPYLLSWLERISINPCCPIASFNTSRQLSNQILQVRKVLSLTNAELQPPRKRKLHQLLDETLTDTQGLPMVKSNRKCIIERPKGSSTSRVPCSVSLSILGECSDQLFKNASSSVRPLRYGDNLSRKRIPFVLPFQAEAVEWSNSSDEEVLLSLDSDDLPSGSSSKSLRSQVHRGPKHSGNIPLEGLQISHSSKVLSSLKRHRLEQASQTSRSSPNIIGDCLPGLAIPPGPCFRADIPEWTGLPHIPFDGARISHSSTVPTLLNSTYSVGTSNPSRKNKPGLDHTSEAPHSSPNFIGDYLPRLAIPVGPRFQADIPEWTGHPNGHHSSSGSGTLDNSERWLGTRSWPIAGKIARSNRKMIGEGRPHSCECESPGSTLCIKRHVIQEKVRLLLELRSTLLSWKFDEINLVPREEKAFFPTCPK